MSVWHKRAGVNTMMDHCSVNTMMDHCTAVFHSDLRPGISVCPAGEAELPSLVSLEVRACRRVADGGRL